MIGFTISRNGLRLSTAGVDDGVLTAIVSWVKRDGQPPDMSFHLGGLDTAGNQERHVDWFDLRDLIVGDEFLLKIDEVATADPPVQVRLGQKQRHTPSGREIECSFCGRLRPEKPGAGVAGPKVLMCAQCLALAAAAAERNLRSLLHLVVEPGACSFCYKEQAATIRAGSYGICVLCVQQVGP